MSGIDYLLLLIVLGGAAGYLHTLEEGAECVTLEGVLGICTRLKKCRGSFSRFGQPGHKITPCSFAKHGLIICCQHMMMPMTERVKPPVAADQSNNPILYSPAMSKPGPLGLQLSQPEDNDVRPVPLAVQPRDPKVPSVHLQTQPDIPRSNITMTKCVEYGEYAFINRPIATLLPIPEYERHLVCAIIAKELVVGGEKAEHNEFPHMAALGFRFDPPSLRVSWECGGSLISEQFVLTAAHCTYKDVSGKVFPVDVVRLGVLNIHGDHDMIGASQTIHVIDRILHKSYKISSNYHDIALLKLQHPAKLGHIVRPACLYTGPGNPPGQKFVIVTGWGLTQADNKDASDYLMKASLELFNHSVCKEAYENQMPRTLHAGILDEYMLCAGDPEGKMDTCQGDSGGPLQITLKNPVCVYSIIGVTSFGSEDCKSSYHPGVYTRVSSYIPWIESIVWP